MKMTDLDHSNGTYAYLVPDADSRSKLAGLQKLFNVPNPVAENDLHMTLIYSRKPCPGAEQAQTEFTPCDATVPKLGFLPAQNGKQCLVAEIDCADAVSLHHHIRETHGASHDYPSYLCHVTLSYDCPSSIRNLHEPVSIRFDRMVVRPLDPSRQGAGKERAE
mgnify:CR=1 FL=1